MRFVSLLALASLVREAKTQQINGLIQTGSADGMQLMDAALEQLVASKKVTARDALDKALDKESFAKLPSVARSLGSELV